MSSRFGLLVGGARKWKRLLLAFVGTTSTGVALSAVGMPLGVVLGVSVGAASMFLLGVTGRDDQERKAMADLRQTLEDTREALRRRSEFVATVSHELRTPLNSIINVPEGLLERFVQLRIASCAACSSTFELEEQEVVGPTTACPSCGKAEVLRVTGTWRYRGDLGVVAENLARVSRSGRSLLALINNVLDLSKLEAGKMELQLSDMSVDATLRDVLEMLGSVGSKTSVTLRLEPSKDDVQLRADPVKFSQVFINLVGNAIKFSPPDTEVLVRFGVEEESCHVSVTDHGIGIAPENHHAIFESFEQVTGAATREFGGTGLGLAITRRYVELHGGSISVESDIGRGSTFHVRLPLNGPAQDGMEVVDIRSGASLRGTVLIVDDEPFAFENLKLTLAPLGCRVVGLRDPRALDAALAQHQPDLIFVDVVMPHLSGLEVLRELRRRPNFPPIVITSAHRANAQVAEALGAEWVEKPWAPDRVKELTRRLLREGATRTTSTDEKRAS